MSKWMKVIAKGSDCNASQQQEWILTCEYWRVHFKETPVWMEAVTLCSVVVLKLEGGAPWRGKETLQGDVDDQGKNMEWN